MVCPYCKDEVLDHEDAYETPEGLVHTECLLEFIEDELGEVEMREVLAEALGFERRPRHVQFQTAG